MEESASPPATLPGECEVFIPATPTCPTQFSKAWLLHVLDDWFTQQGVDTSQVDIVDIAAARNGLQGQLSTTYTVDVEYMVGNTAPGQKSLFVKVPLVGPAAQSFKAVNVREECMLTRVLPQLQTFIQQHCTDVLRLPIPEVVYSHYTGDEVHDVFVLANLVADGFSPYQEGDLAEENLKSCLECLAQLHGTGLAYKHEVGGVQAVLARFPGLEEQAQIKDILDKRDTRKCVRRNFLPFLKFLEVSDPGLTNYTSFLSKVEKRLFRIFKVLSESGLDSALTLCHGDSKPDNFLFRKIEIDLEDMECEGLESILIDWQGGFLGSVSNDLMWLLPPFLEANSDNRELLEFSLEYYCTQMNHVLSSFGRTAGDVGLPADLQQFARVIKRCFILEFLNVVVINPIIQMSAPAELRTWYRRRVRHEERVAAGKPSRPPAMPTQQTVFAGQNFLKFANLYFKRRYTRRIWTSTRTMYTRTRRWS